MVTPPPTEILGLLEDCARLIQEFYPSISVASLQLHYHIIPFLPVKSQVWQVYGPKSQARIAIKAGQEQVWSSCAQVLEEHTDSCRSVAFSPDGGQLVTGSEDHTVRLWDVHTGAVLQVMTGHDNMVHSVAYSPDGTFIASGSLDRTVKIWDAASGLQVSKYTGHSHGVMSVAFSADGCHDCDVIVTVRALPYPRCHVASVALSFLFLLLTISRYLSVLDSSHIAQPPPPFPDVLPLTRAVSSSSNSIMISLPYMALLVPPSLCVLSNSPLLNTSPYYISVPES
jgi:WD40 repeat protein